METTRSSPEFASPPGPSAAALAEAGLALLASGQARRGVGALSRAVALDPGLTLAWRALRDQFSLAGYTVAARDAHARGLAAALTDTPLGPAAAAAAAGRFELAEQHLARHPAGPDVALFRAELFALAERWTLAKAAFRECLDVTPDSPEARSGLILALLMLDQPEAALSEVEILRHERPGLQARLLQLDALERADAYEPALALLETLIGEFPDHPKTWVRRGALLRTLGRAAESVAAYRKAIELFPTLGDAYWGLANLKTYRFTPTEIAALRDALARPDLPEPDRCHMHFAFGKALEDAGDPAAAFANYAAANRLRRARTAYVPSASRLLADRTKDRFTPQFLASRAGGGVADQDPIFIVGMPRAGSTLVEQILASHSSVEGTRELPVMGSLAVQLAAELRPDDLLAYLERLAQLSPDRLADLGNAYLERTRIYRRQGRPRFVDKMPGNFLFVGLIHLILPNARIIDARRHPMACGWSCYKQDFTDGQGFSFDLEHIGRFYADYADLMAHFDRVLPGRVHRVRHERLVTDPDGEIGRLLDYCGLSHEDACRRFYETPRPVRTPSSEQVRRPLFADGLDQWRAFEPWLGPLKAALGASLSAYDTPSADGPEMDMACRGGLREPASSCASDEPSG